MHRFSTLALGLLFIVPAFGQTTSADSQTLQALLAEVRQLRQDLRASTAITQRTQILFHRLQAQEAAVARVERRLDDAREKLQAAEAERNHFAAEIKKHEDFISNSENPSSQRKEMEDALPQLKAKLPLIDNQVQLEQGREAEARDQLRLEQAKLDTLQAELDRLEKSVENSSR